MLRHVALVRTDVSEELEGGAKFLRNVGSYKNHYVTSQKTPIFK
jgi:hypothetical protein